jgi:DNA-binding MarR family transcriptional regulator
MSPDSPLRLENQLCFALYAATNAITRSYRGLLGDVGLTYPQYLVLLALFEQQTLTSGELARALRLDAGTLTPMLKRLATAGLIERTRRSGDERVIDNRLTANGTALWDDLKETQAQVECWTQLSKPKLEALREELHKLTDALCSATERETEFA